MANNELFREGEYVRVVRNRHGHQIPLGNIVKIQAKRYLDCNDYMIKDPYYSRDDPLHWAVIDDELECISDKLQNVLNFVERHLNEDYLDYKQTAMVEAIYRKINK